MNDNRAADASLCNNRKIKILLLILADSSSLPSVYLDSDRLSS